MTEELFEALDALPSLMYTSSNTIITTLSTTIQDAIIRGSKSTLVLLGTLLLWMFKDILNIGKTHIEPVVGEVESVETAISKDIEVQIKEKIQHILSLREKIVDVALTYMNLDESTTSSNSTTSSDNNTYTSPIIRKLQVEGYHAINNLMLYFPVRLSDYTFINTN
jgi:hypothetical protein